MPRILSRIFSTKATRGQAVLWLGVFLLLQAMVALPGLHALVHADAANPNHQCAVTLFSHGQVASSDTAVCLVRPEPISSFRRPLVEVLFVSSDLRLLPGRGPPAA